MHYNYRCQSKSTTVHLALALHRDRPAALFAEMPCQSINLHTMLPYQKCGVFRAITMSRPEIIPAAGKVKTHPRKIKANCRQFVASSVKFIKLTPIVAPVRQ